MAKNGRKKLTYHIVFFLVSLGMLIQITLLTESLEEKSNKTNLILQLQLRILSSITHLRTNVALEGFLAQVDSIHMLLQVTRLAERLLRCEERKIVLISWLFNF